MSIEDARAMLSFVNELDEQTTSPDRFHALFTTIGSTSGRMFRSIAQE